MKRTPLAALALVLGLACAACSDDPEPKFSPPESASPAPTKTERTSEPPKPDPLGPEETVRAWVEARNVAMATGDVTQLQELSAAECSSCTDQIEPIKQVHEAGGHFDTKGWRVKKAKVDSQSTSRARVSTALVLAGGNTVPESGAEPVVYPPEKRIAIFELTKGQVHWSIALIGFVR